MPSATAQRLAHASRALGRAPPRLHGFDGDYAAAHVWPEHDLFSSDDVRSLLDEPVHGRYVSLRAALTKVADGVRLGKATGVVAGYGTRWTARNPMRWDITLSNAWVDEARKTNGSFAKADANARSVRKMRGCGRAKVVWHAMLVRPGSPSQEDHVDAPGGKCYYTYVVPLEGRANGGGTFFPHMGLAFQQVGGAVLFRGDVLHRGLGNQSTEDRVFLYAAIFAGEDPNE